MGKISGSEALLKALLAENVRYIFGIPGGQWIPFLDAIHRLGRKQGLEFIMTRHEQAAAHMADAYSRLTNEVGVCLGTVGPGAVDLVPGVYEAFSESSALLALTVQVQSWKAYPDTGSMQYCDHKELFAPITKWNAVVWQWRRIPELVQRAFRSALSGTPSPVHLDIPVDVLFYEGDEEELNFLPPENYRIMEKPAPSPQTIDRVVEMIKVSSNPLIHAGGAVQRSGAFEELKAVAERLQAAVTTTVYARAAFPDNHPLSFIPMGFGAISAQSEADLVINLGARLCAMDMWGREPGWGLPEEQKLVQVDINPESIALNRKVDVAVQADVGEFLRALLKRLEEENIKRDKPNERLELYRDTENTWLEEFIEDGKSDAKPIHPLRPVGEFRKYFPDDAVVVLDGGNSQVWSTYLTRINHPFTFMAQSDSGMLGGGLPKAIAAKLIFPDRPVYLLSGDGAFMFNIQELETARRLNLPIVVGILNDRAWGMIKADQPEGRYIGVDFSDAKYSEIAKGFGCYGERITDPSEIKSALDRAVESGLPAVLDILVDPEVNLKVPDLETLDGIWLDELI
jgi:acetolactate synthase-1/2/3 large subunit